MLGKYTIYAALLFLFLYFAVLLHWWGGLSGSPVIVTIPQVASARETAKILKKSGVITSKNVFLAIAAISGYTKDFKAGIYEISPKDNIFHILAILAKGKSKYVKVTIPEGFTNLQIAEKLSLSGVTDHEAFYRFAERESFEGYLFPETYYFSLNMPEAKVAAAMVEQFNLHFSSAMKERAGAIKGMNERDILVLASIIEKEAVLDAERPVIAAVFYNRIKKRMYLESCATVLYALGKHKEKLTYQDLKIDSPYNTYRHYGLPPGPICNPGLASIKAALYPAETDDLFFVVKSSGTHAFSRYYKEHLKEKRKLKTR